jgi:hypothetical protein
VEVLGAHCSLYSFEPHALSHLIANAGESDGYALAFQMRNQVQQLVEGGGVDQVNRPCIEKNMPRRGLARRQRSLQTMLDMTNAGEEQIAAGTPDQQSGESDRFRM